MVYTVKDVKLVTINTLEYDSLIVNYVAVSYMLTHMHPTKGDPHPVVINYTDKRAAESWLIQASKLSHTGRTICYIQAAFTVNIPVGINAVHMMSKDNHIAD